MSIVLGALAVLSVLFAFGTVLEARRAAARLELERERGHVDAQTGLPTLEPFLERLLAECKRAERRQQRLAWRIAWFDDATTLARVADGLAPFPAQGFRIGVDAIALVQPDAATPEALDSLHGVRIANGVFTPTGADSPESVVDQVAAFVAAHVRGGTGVGEPAR